MNNLAQRDLNHNWHPCSQMQDYETFTPLIVQRAFGSYIELADGNRLIDAISSWWCKSLGHGHPQLKHALKEQLDQFEQVIFANTTFEAIVQLSEKLVGLTQTLDKVFYAGDGSTAVEIALKMSLHVRHITGDFERQQFMALENGYHGESALTLSLSDIDLYRKPYEAILTKMVSLTGIPYVANKDDPLWDDCSAYWPTIEMQLNNYADSLTAIIIEPIVQGAAGMLLYSQDFLQRLRQWTQCSDVHLIADEIMTGLYRTGLPLAIQHAAIEPDFLCLGKGLTSGFLPLSAMLTTTKIYNYFYADYAENKAFMHSNTFSGNALAAKVALACLSVMETENIQSQVILLEQQLSTLMLEVSKNTGMLTNLRGIGGIIAADLINPAKLPRLGYKVYQAAVKRGALLRPLGNTIYWLPPLNTEFNTLLELKNITQESILAVV